MYWKLECLISKKICSRRNNINVTSTESREVSLNRNVYDFSVNYNSIGKSDILNIHKYLTNNDNIK